MRSQVQIKFMKYLVLTMVLTLASRISANEFSDTVKPFVATYCTGCHGSKVQKGDRRFDTLSMSVADMAQKETAIMWQDMLDKLNLGEMTPKRKRQPSEKEVRAVVGQITQALQHAYEQSKTSESPLRRLNKFEYRNTIRDLLHLNTDSFDPTVSFPADGQEEGFDNNAKTLILSGHLLKNYLNAASEALDKAEHFGPDRNRFLFV